MRREGPVLNSPREFGGLRRLYDDPAHVDEPFRDDDGGVLASAKPSTPPDARRWDVITDRGLCSLATHQNEDLRPNLSQLS
jgi:hypothetical protein